MYFTFFSSKLFFFLSDKSSNLFEFVTALFFLRLKIKNCDKKDEKKNIWVLLIYLIEFLRIDFSKSGSYLFFTFLDAIIRVIFCILFLLLIAKKSLQATYMAMSIDWTSQAGQATSYQFKLQATRYRFFGKAITHVWNFGLFFLKKWAFVFCHLKNNVGIFLLKDIWIPDPLFFCRCSIFCFVFRFWGCWRPNQKKKKANILWLK